MVCLAEFPGFKFDGEAEDEERLTRDPACRRAALDASRLNPSSGDCVTLDPAECSYPVDESEKKTVSNANEGRHIMELCDLIDYLHQALGKINEKIKGNKND